MIGQIGSFEDMVEKGQGVAQNIKKSAVQGVQNFANTTVSQANGQNTALSDQGVNETASGQNQMTDDQRQQFLRDLYGAKPKPAQAAVQGPQKPKVTVKTALGLADSSRQKVPTPAETIKTAMGLTSSQKNEDPVPTKAETIKTAMGIPDLIPSKEKSPEEEAKLEVVRRQLHGQYYQDLTNPKKAPEETVAEKLEREDQEEKMAEIETKKDKPPELPSTVKQGTGESVVGVSG